MISDKELADKFLYPNGVLKNKLEITDDQKLHALSYKTAAKQAALIYKAKPKIKTIDDLNVIHKIMFGSLFSWAGITRNYNLTKTSKVNGEYITTQFLEYQVLNQGEIMINNELANLSDGPVSPQHYANLLDSINYLHPFREGNGRSTKCFLQCLAQNHGQAIDYDRDQEKFITAENASDIDSLAKLLQIEEL